MSSGHFLSLPRLGGVFGTCQAAKVFVVGGERFDLLNERCVDGGEQGDSVRELLEHHLFIGGGMGEVIETTLEFLVLDGSSSCGDGMLGRRGPRSHGGIHATTLACPVQSLVRKLSQLVSPLVPELPDCPRFGGLGIAFPLAGLVKIILQSKDVFRCCDKNSGIGEREVGAGRLALGILNNFDVYRYSSGVHVVSLDDGQEVDGVNGIDSPAAFFEKFDEIGRKDIRIECDGVAQLADPHIVDEIKDEGSGAADTHVVEGVIRKADLPDDLEFSGLGFGILRDGGKGADVIRRGERLAVLCGKNCLREKYDP